MKKVLLSSVAALAVFAAAAPAFSCGKYRCSDASRAYNRGTADRGRRPAVLQP